MKMPYEYVIDKSNRIATINLSGSVRGQDVAEAIESVYEHPDWAGGFALLGDLTNVTEAVVEQADFSALLAIHRKHEAVAPRTEVILVRRHLDQIIAGAYRAYMKPARHRVHVCTSLAQVLELL